MLTLRTSTIEHLADMICGNGEDNKFAKNFPYRTSSALTRFCRDCDLEDTHDGSTRKYWVLEILKKLNFEPSNHPDLPSDAMLTVITQLMETEYWENQELNRSDALKSLNTVLERESLFVYEDDSRKCHVQNAGTVAISSQQPVRPRALTAVEKEQKQRIIEYLETASEDDFTEKILVPFFQRQGFYRVEVAGHKEKLLEFGKDLWMKFQLPTSHWIYFCAQVKRVKIDSRGVSKGNVAEVLNQAKMAMDHPIFDPEMNRKVLLDHLFLISAGEITKQARDWLVQHLDAGQRRHIIFMDREDFLCHAARIISDVPLSHPK